MSEITNANYEIEWWDARDRLGNATREFRLILAGGREVTGALWLPVSEEPATALLCFGHGASGDRYQLPICELAAAVTHAQPYAALAIDGPIHGLRGEPGEASDMQARTIQRFIEPDCIPNMVEDWNTAIAAVQALPEVLAGPLGYFGLSMGSMLGLSFVAQRDDVQVAVFGLVGADRETFPHGGVMLDAAAAITCPTLFLMSYNDEIFSVERYLNVFEALGASDKRLHANPGGHASLPGDEVRYTEAFILRNLPVSKPRRVTQITDSVPGQGG